MTPPNMTDDPLVGKHIIDWVPSKYYVGEMAALAESDYTGEAFQHIKLDVEMTGDYVSLNAGLKEFLGSLKLDDVEKYLRDHLLWKVGKANFR